ncbi:hypothetical protein L208DRAFT_1231421, partial [Tricholoma matsutake]
SCAYDATITVLFNIWCEDPTLTTASWQVIDCNILHTLTHHSVPPIITQAAERHFSLDQIRDYFRWQMSRISEEFTIGRYASVHSIFLHLLKTAQAVALTHVECPNLHDVDRNQGQIQSCELISFEEQGTDVQSCMDNFRVLLGSACPTCDTNLVQKTTYVQAPPLLVFDLGQHVPTMNCVIYITKEGQCMAYKLIGVIYYANEHFTAHVITSSGQTWFHDGMFIGCSLLYKSQVITSIDTNGAVLAVYVSESLS